MIQLFQLLIRYGGFATFVVVEVICFFVIISYNQEKKEIYAYTTGVFAGNIMERRQNLIDYNRLKIIRDSLIKENALLYQKLMEHSTVQIPYRDSFLIVKLDSFARNDSTFWKREARPQYDFIAAKVISNSINGANNWLMLNRGSKDGIRPDMGVVTPKGIVGIVRHVSSNFSLVMSVLHRETKISVALKLRAEKDKDKEKALGSLIWEGDDNPDEMTLKYIPRHFDMQIGDQVVTSGFSAFFPKDVPVGYIKTQPKEDDENQYFSIAKVRLSQDMSTVNNVYVVDNIFHTELDSLNKIIRNEQ
jgi:rod shape-determining protein MreC